MTKNNSNNINSHKDSRLGLFVGVSAVIIVVVIIVKLDDTNTCVKWFN